jgi:hypothetical protein
MRALLVFLAATLIAGCAGRSAPDAAAAPPVAATGEPVTDVETVDASSLTGNEPACKRRPVTGSIIPQRVCQGRSAGPDEVVDEQEIRDTLQDLERTHTTGGLVIR